MTRRAFVKAQAAAIAAAAAGLPIVTSASNLVTEADMVTLDWNVSTPPTILFSAGLTCAMARSSSAPTAVLRIPANSTPMR